MLDDNKTINIMLEPKERAVNSADKDNDNRDSEYLPQNKLTSFVHFLTTNFMPRVQEKFNISKKPAKLTICGSSLSGFAAMYVGINHPDVFGNVLTQSAALWNDEVNNQGRLMKKLETDGNSTLQNSRFYMETSKIESPDVFNSNHKFAKTMKLQGITHTLIETCGEHSFLTWLKTLPTAVATLEAQQQHAARHAL